jgi:hypothetical protein
MSLGSTQSTYGMTGTSLCYNFTATMIVPNAEGVVQVGAMGPGDMGWIDVPIRGYGSRLSNITMTRKSEKELTRLESAGCMALAGYDRKALESMFSVISLYSTLKVEAGPTIALQVGPNSGGGPVGLMQVIHSRMKPF